MRKIGVLFGVMSLVLIGAVSPARAANPHFVGPLSCVQTGASLTVSGKIAGLGNSQTVTVVVDATATTQCRNPGGNIAPGQTKTVEGEDTFQASRSGQVTFSVTTEAVTGACPNGKWTALSTFVSGTVTVSSSSVVLLQQDCQ